MDLRILLQAQISNNAYTPALHSKTAPAEQRCNVMNDTQQKLVNIPQIAEMGSRHLATAHRWALRDDFPKKQAYRTKALLNARS